MLIWAVRALYLLILAGAAARVSSEFSGTLSLSNNSYGPFLLFVGILGAGAVVVMLDALFPRKKIAVVSAIFFGLLVGSLLAHLLSMAFGPTLILWGSSRLSAPFLLIMTIVLCYLCVSILLQTKDDFRFIIPYVEFSRSLKGRRSVILDTSVIIDGRIADLAETGLIDQSLLVPRFVLAELQTIADSPDRNRRSRGRRGLDVLDRLQHCSRVEVEIYDSGTDPRDQRRVDAKLIALARSLTAKLATNDLNLAKTARIQGLETININEVSAAARPPVQHGDMLRVQLIKEGEEPGQAIGYLDDGTMVVAEMARAHVGKEVPLVVTSVLQTHAGRMVFGRLEGVEPDGPMIPDKRGRRDSRSNPTVTDERSGSGDRPPEPKSSTGIESTRRN
ncbi:MAG: PIN/TRAM domain-containing protein [Planctomycetia bacterium]